jgi:acyl-CoA thioester hydrolase
MEKTPSSAYPIRFSDCDPFGHLNNARFLDYFLHAREEHLKSYYDLDLTTFYKQGLSWVVGGHEIFYLKPAKYAEIVNIETSLIDFSETSLLVEMRMLNEQATETKSIVWTSFIPVNTATGKRDKQSAEFMAFLSSIHNEEVDVKAGLKTRLASLITKPA